MYTYPLDPTPTPPYTVLNPITYTLLLHWPLPPNMLTPYSPKLYGNTLSRRACPSMLPTHHPPACLWVFVWVGRVHTPRETHRNTHRNTHTTRHTHIETHYSTHTLLDTHTHYSTHTHTPLDTHTTRHTHTRGEPTAFWARV